MTLGVEHLLNRLLGIAKCLLALILAFVGLPFTIFKTVPVTFLFFDGALADLLPATFAAFWGRLIAFFETPGSFLCASLFAS
jgi:hypothetical protein